MERFHLAMVFSDHEFDVFSLCVSLSWGLKCDVHTKLIMLGEKELLGTCTSALGWTHKHRAVVIEGYRVGGGGGFPYFRKFPHFQIRTKCLNH